MSRPHYCKMTMPSPKRRKSPLSQIDNPFTLMYLGWGRLMCFGARNHGIFQRMRGGSSARPLALVIAISAALAQFAFSWHESTVQHVRCTEHGELTHVSAHAATAAVFSTRVDRIRRAPAVEIGDAHEHCALAFTVEGGSQAPVLRTAVRLATPRAPMRPEHQPALRVGRTIVLASAPKTSPPSA